MTGDTAHDPYSSLVPRRLLAWPDGVSYRDLRGTILFVDIAGFTRLTETAQARHGNRGVESLTVAINALFTDLIGTIEGYGGDIVKFGGDALLVAYDEEPANETPVSRAVQSAQQLYRVVARHRRRQLRGLSLHIGIAAGRWAEHVVGRADSRREHFIYGPAIVDAMTAAEDSTDRARIRCLTASLPRDLGLGFRSMGRANFEVTGHRPGRSTTLAAGVDAAPISEVRSFVPSVLREWIETRASSFDLGAEHRRVTTLFTFWDCHGQLDARHRHEAFESVFAAVENAVSGSTGFWARSDPSGARQKLLFLFGALQSRNDDALRALESALRLREAFADIRRDHTGFRAGIGVATATVFTGFVGSALRREFTVMGDGINLAARLAAKAPQGTIQVDDATRHLARGYAFQSLGAVAFKNIRRPIPTYRLLGRSEAHEPRMDDGVVEHPLAMIRVCERWEHARSSPLELSASPEADAHKFIRDFRNRTAISAQHFRELLFEESDGATPFGGLRRLLAELCAISSAADLALPQHPATRSDNDPLNAIFGDASALARLIRQSGMDALPTRLASRPDLHSALGHIPAEIELVSLHGLETLSHMDQELLRLLIADGRTRCRFVLIRRSGEMDEESADTIHLGSLERHEFRGFLNALLAPSLPTPQLVDLLYQRSGGNARLARLHLSHLDARGVLQSTGKPPILRITDTTGLDLPEDLRAHYLQQVDQLLPATQTLLRAASVFSDRAPLTLLRKLVADTSVRSEWDAAENEAASNGLIEIRDAATTLAFRDPICRQALYETMSYALRERCHRIVGRIYREARNTEPAAEHLYRARAPEALPLLERCARHARRLWLLDRARLFFRWAILASANRCDPEFTKAVPPIPARISAPQKSLFVELAEILRLQGQHDDCARIHQRLARRAGETRERQGQAEHLLVVARCHWYAGRYNASARDAGRAAEIAARYHHRGLKAEASLLLGEVFRRTGRVHTAMEAYQDALHQVDRRSRPTDYADIENGLGLLHWSLGQLDRAEACFKAALQGLGARTDPSRRGQITNNLGLIVEEQGRLPTAERHYQKAFDLFDRYGMRRRRAYSLGNLANLHRHAARYEHSRTAYEEVELELRAIGEAHPAAYTVGNLGDLARDFGDFPTARRNYEATLGFAKRSGDEELKAECHARLGMLCLLEQRLRSVPGHLRAAHAAAARAQSQEFSLHTLLVEAEYQLQRGKMPGALERFAAARKQAATVRLLYYQLWAAFGMSKALAESGEHATALRLTLRTARIAQRSGYHWWHFHSLVLAAKLTQRLNDRAYDDLLAQASTLRAEIERGIGDDTIRESFSLLPVIQRLDSAAAGTTHALSTFPH